MLRIVLPLLLLVGGCALPAFSQSEPAPHEATRAGSRTDIDVATFATHHAEGVKVIDVRTDREYKGGHVPGALHVPVSRASTSAPEIAAHPKDEPLYVICEVGGRSSTVASRLVKDGYTVVNVDGGTADWVAKGYPVER